MSKPKVYMAGPIQHTEDYYHWRDELAEKYDQFDWLNPLDKYDTQVKNLQLVSDDYDEQDVASGRTPVTCSEIVEGDKEMIDKSDAVIVGWTIVPSCGTPMEVSHTYDRNILATWLKKHPIISKLMKVFGFDYWNSVKPIVVVYDGEDRISPWMEYHSDYLTSDYKTGVDYLQGEIL